MLNVSIVSYFTPIEDIEQVISWLTKSKYINRIYLIENSKRDIEYFNSEFVVTHNLPKNPGYGTAHNFAMTEMLDKVDVTHHLVINADVIMDAAQFDEFYEFYRDLEYVGLVSPLLYNIDGSYQKTAKQVPNFQQMALRMFGLKALSSKLELDLSSLQRCNVPHINVGYLSGAFMLLRCDHIETYGGFDERFFLYPEDIDLSRRYAAKHAAFVSIKFKCFHGHGALSKKSIKLRIIHALEMMKYFWKWGYMIDKERSLINNENIALLKHHQEHGHDSHILETLVPIDNENMLRKISISRSFLILKNIPYRNEIVIRKCLNVLSKNKSDIKVLNVMHYLSDQIQRLTK